MLRVGSHHHFALSAQRCHHTRHSLLRQQQHGTLRHREVYLLHIARHLHHVLVQHVTVACHHYHLVHVAVHAHRLHYRTQFVRSTALLRLLHWLCQHVGVHSKPAQWLLLYLGRQRIFLVRVVRQRHLAVLVVYRHQSCAVSLLRECHLAPTGGRQHTEQVSQALPVHAHRVPLLRPVLLKHVHALHHLSRVTVHSLAPHHQVLVAVGAREGKLVRLSVPVQTHTFHYWQGWPCRYHTLHHVEDFLKALHINSNLVCHHCFFVFLLFSCLVV